MSPQEPHIHIPPKIWLDMGECDTSVVSVNKISAQLWGYNLIPTIICLSLFGKWEYIDHGGMDSTCRVIGLSPMWHRPIGRLTTASYGTSRGYILGNHRFPKSATGASPFMW